MKPLILPIFALTLAACTTPSSEPPAVKYTWTHSVVGQPDPGFHDMGSEDLLMIRVENPTPKPVNIPISKDRPSVFRLVLPDTIWDLHVPGRRNDPSWVIPPHDTASRAFTTPVEFPQRTFEVSFNLQNPNEPSEVLERDTVDLEKQLAAGRLERRADFADSASTWVEVLKGDGYFFDWMFWEEIYARGE